MVIQSLLFVLIVFSCSIVWVTTKTVVQRDLEDT